MFSTEELVCSCQQEPYPSSNYLVLCILQMEYRIQVAVWYKQFHSLIGKALFHRITSWLRLEGSFEYCLVQPLPAQGSNTSFHSVLRNLPSCHNLSKIIEWLCSDIGHLPQHMWVYPVKSLELCKSC